MLRAVGLRRRSLVGAFATEGWCYAVLSAIAGTFVGLGLGSRARWPRPRSCSPAAATTPASRCTSPSSGRACNAGLVVGFVIAITTVMVDQPLVESLQHHPGDPRHHRARRPPAAPAFELRRHRRARRSASLLTVVGIVNASFLALMLGPVARLRRCRADARPQPAAVVVNTVIGGVVLVWAVVAVPVAIALDMQRRRDGVRRAGARARRRGRRGHRAAPARDRPRRRAGREAVARGPARSRVSAGAALPNVDDARHVRARRVHPRAGVGVRVDVLRSDRSVHPRRVGRVQRGGPVEPDQPGRARTRSPREPGVRAVAPLSHAERADHRRARPHRAA